MLKENEIAMGVERPPQITPEEQLDILKRTGREAVFACVLELGTGVALGLDALIKGGKVRPPLLGFGGLCLIASGFSARRSRREFNEAAELESSIPS